MFRLCLIKQLSFNQVKKFKAVLKYFFTLQLFALPRFQAAIEPGINGPIVVKSPIKQMQLGFACGRVRILCSHSANLHAVLVFAQKYFHVISKICTTRSHCAFRVRFFPCRWSAEGEREKGERQQNTARFCGHFPVKGNFCKIFGV